MSTKDPPPGLFSKVAKFVRNPTTNWSDLDKQDPEPDQGYSKQALKEMIERKRQNDFVRKREFDQLRKLRSRDPAAGSPELAGRPSYFQSSLPANPGERAMTIKKIDEIEAQMSNQWWQGKGEAAKAGAKDETAPQASTASAAEPAAKHAQPAPDSAYAPTKLASISDIGYAATKLAPMMPDMGWAEQADFVATQTNSSFGRAAANEAMPGTRSVGSGFANSQSFAIELIEVVTDPELEEAAIRFANGDHAGAESSLMGALQETGAKTAKQTDSWTSALFDLYRATGQQARFDNVAIDYAERSGRSAPAWFSIPDRLGLNGARAEARTVSSRLSDEPLWQSPAVFQRGSLDELQLAIANADQPWFLDWSELTQVDSDAAGQLAQLFSQWCSTTVSLRFKGAQALGRALRGRTASGSRDGGQAPWRLRLDALRLMGLQDEFELVALDYCVTFEVSPPAWQDTKCGFESEAVRNDETQAAELPAQTALQDLPNQAATVLMGYDAAPAPVVELTGEIVGEATDALERLEAARAGADRLVISCSNLIRVDFSAAGSILNWVATCQAEGCQLQFRDVHRLVAAFFHVIGINEHARVVLRST